MDKKRYWNFYYHFEFTTTTNNERFAFVQFVTIKSSCYNLFGPSWRILTEIESFCSSLGASLTIKPKTPPLFYSIWQPAAQIDFGCFFPGHIPCRASLVWIWDISNSGWRLLPHHRIIDLLLPATWYRALRKPWTQRCSCWRNTSHAAKIEPLSCFRV